MRASQPIRDGYVERDGVKIFYEVFGSGEPTVLLLPTWSIIHSRQWKMQIPYLSRHCRVITFDGRGNGRSDRPTDAGSDTPRPSSRPMPSRCWMRRRLLARSSSASRWAHSEPCFLPPTIRTGSRRRASSARAIQGGGEPISGTNGLRVGGRARHRRGLGEVQQAGTGGATIAASSSSSSPRCSPNRIRPSRSKTASTGASIRLARRSR